MHKCGCLVPIQRDVRLMLHIDDLIDTWSPAACTAQHRSGAGRELSSGGGVDGRRGDAAGWAQAATVQRRDLFAESGSLSVALSVACQRLETVSWLQSFQKSRNRSGDSSEYRNIAPCAGCSCARGSVAGHATYSGSIQRIPLCHDTAQCVTGRDMLCGDARHRGDRDTVCACNAGCPRRERCVPSSRQRRSMAPGRISHLGS
jgi:hypothetical protein